MREGGSGGRRRPWVGAAACVEVAIDLGSANAVVALAGRGVVLRLPSAIAVEREGGRLRAIGEEAVQMVGRAPGQVVAVRPLRAGVVADFDLAEAFLRALLRRLGSRGLQRWRLALTVPTGASALERRLLRELAQRAGAKRVELVERPIAAALGLGLDLARPAGHMVVHLGAGSTDVAVLSLGGPHARAHVPIGGAALDTAVQQEVRRCFGLAVGEAAAEQVKLAVGSVHPEGRPGVVEVKGRDVVSGLPRSLELSWRDVLPALEPAVRDIVAAVHGILQRTSPELSADVGQEGIWLTGGTALLHGLPELLAGETGVPVRVAEDPMATVARGALAALGLKVREDHLALFPRVV